MPPRLCVCDVFLCIRLYIVFFSQYFSFLRHLCETSNGLSSSTLFHRKTFCHIKISFDANAQHTFNIYTNADTHCKMLHGLNTFLNRELTEITKKRTDNTSHKRNISQQNVKQTKHIYVFYIAKRNITYKETKQHKRNGIL